MTPSRSTLLRDMFDLDTLPVQGLGHFDNLVLACLRAGPRRPRREAHSKQKRFVEHLCVHAHQKHEASCEPWMDAPMTVCQTLVRSTEETRRQLQNARGSQYCLKTGRAETPNAILNAPDAGHAGSIIRRYWDWTAKTPAEHSSVEKVCEEVEKQSRAAGRHG